MPGERLDLSSDPNPTGDGDPQSPAKREAKRFLGIHFTCCDVYSRVYVNRAGTAYEGHCPRCSRPIRVEIGPGGSTSRFFTAG